MILKVAALVAFVLAVMLSVFGVTSLVQTIELIGVGLALDVAADLVR